MMNGQLEQQVFDGNTQVSVTLTLTNWNQVLNMISEAPWKIADPLMQEVRKQIGQGLQGQQPQKVGEGAPLQ